MTALERQPCSPGSHPHADQPNWCPADTITDYIRNCQEGLESYSDRRAAKLLGISRAELWRWKLMAELPEALFKALLTADRKPSSKALASVALALKGNGREADVEKCPHCGGVLRVRLRVSSEYRKIVDDWLAKMAPIGKCAPRRADEQKGAGIVLGGGPRIALTTFREHGNV